MLTQTQPCYKPAGHLERGLKDRRLVVLTGTGQVPGKFELLGSGEYPADFAGCIRSPEQNAAIEAKLARAGARRLAAAAILSRHWKQDNSVEEAMLELYHAAISVAQADEVARLLWGEGTGVAMVGEYYREISRRITDWLRRKIPASQVYVFFQMICVRQWINNENTISRQVAVIGVGHDGIRQGLAVADASATEGLWDHLLLDLKQRGLRETALFVGGNDPAAHAAVARHFPSARYQGCWPHLQRATLEKVSVSEIHSVARTFEHLGECTSEERALAGTQALVDRLREIDLPEAAAVLEPCAAFQFSYLRFPSGHWSRLRDVEPLKNVLSKFREHVRLIGPVGSDEALTLMVAARMRHVSRLSWKQRRFIQL